MFRYLLYISLAALLLILAITCKDGNIAGKKVITIKGSDTMINLTQRWAEEYMKANNNVSIQITGGGSGTGIAALLNGTANIANISRELKEQELNKAKDLNITPYKIKVALDGIAIIVSPSNPIDTLTMNQLRDIFSGKYTNWKQLGGNDMRIVLYGRENSSGTYEYFKQRILGRDVNDNPIDFSTSTQVLQGTAALGEAVARDKKGIGYGGVGYFVLRNDLKVIHIKADKNIRAISPVMDNSVNYKMIWDGEYPLSRYLYCYTNGKPSGEVKDFINFVLSEEGQQVVEDMEYIPLPSNKTLAINN